MKKNDFKKLQPNMYDIVNGFNKWNEETDYKNSDQVSFNKGVFWVLNYLENKFSDFTDDELLAIEEFKTDKLSAVKFLMSESNYGLREAKDFLDKHSIQNKETQQSK